jgi:hypothetical protein
MLQASVSNVLSIFQTYVTSVYHPVRLNLSARISQPFSSVFLSQQISISISHQAELLQAAEQGVYLEVAYVSQIRCKCFIWMLDNFFNSFSSVFASVSDACFNVSNVCFKCFICLHTNVANIMHDPSS